jgi:biopolymer transport protein ExbD
MGEKAMLQDWLNRARSLSSLERQKIAKVAVAAVVVVVGAICMLQNSQPNYTKLGPDLLADVEDDLPPAPTADVQVTARSPRYPMPVAPVEATLDQLVIHVDKHGNIDVAGELINADVFRNLLHTVKGDSTGELSVLIHANKNCEVSTLQRVVDVCEECLTQYRLRIEENQAPSKSGKAALSGRA